MKARDYAERLKADPRIPTLDTIKAEFKQEYWDLVRLHHVYGRLSYDEQCAGYYAVINELDIKWNRMIELSGVFPTAKGGFLRYLEQFDKNGGFRAYQRHLKNLMEVP